MANGIIKLKGNECNEMNSSMQESSANMTKIEDTYKQIIIIH